MRFKEILKGIMSIRITGIITPIFGISWNPENTKRDITIEALDTARKELGSFLNRLLASKRENIADALTNDRLIDKKVERLIGL